MTKDQLLEQAKPILFNTEMVQAILDGRKNCTRRVAKGIVPFDESGKFNVLIRGEWTGPIPKADVIQLKSKYKPGAILYVRETYCPNYFEEETQYGNRHGYRADYEQAIKSTDLPKLKWVPSIHMPKAAARIFLKITDIRVERLQDMNLDDFLSEGVEPRPEAFNDPENAYQQAKKIFQGIWNSTITKAEQNSYSWEANPWVWVIEFERVIPE